MIDEVTALNMLSFDSEKEINRDTCVVFNLHILDFSF